MSIVPDIMALVGQLTVPALAIDGEGRIGAANGAIGRYLGCDPTELIGTALAGWIIDAAALPGFLRAGSGAWCEFRFRAGNGDERALALSLALHVPAGGLLTAFDLTPRRAAEREMQQEVARYRDITSAASDWFFELDNTMTRMRLLMPRATKSGMTLIERHHKWPDEVVDVTYDPDGFGDVIRTMLAQKPVRDYVHRQIGGDGKARYLRSCCVPFYGADGGFQGYRGVAVDVTAQVLAEHALRESEARFRRSQQHLERAQRVAATGSIELDLVTGVQEWSEGMCRLLGIEAASLAPVDQTILARVHDEDRERVAAAIASARSGAQPPPGEFRVVRDGGEVRTLYFETEVVCGKKGKPVRSTAVFKDVTELRAAEKRERDMERQLLHAQKLEALGTLAGGIAHDLNNTLVPILALTKLTANRLPADSRERTNLTTVIQASERARELVQQILAFSRKQNSEKRTFDLAATIREALSLLRASLPATVQLRERVADAPGFFGDSGQLHQVVVNLVTNAAQAIGAALGAITVELAPVAGEPLVCLAIEDTGCGMDEATMARVFEPFFTTKAVGQGTGLGLSLVHGIVTSHGGRIEISSQVGKGTRFAIYLPLAKGVAGAEPASTGAVRGVDAPGPEQRAV